MTIFMKYLIIKESEGICTVIMRTVDSESDQSTCDLTTINEKLTQLAPVT